MLIPMTFQTIFWRHVTKRHEGSTRRSTALARRACKAHRIHAHAATPSFASDQRGPACEVDSSPEARTESAFVVMYTITALLADGVLSIGKHEI